MNNPTPGDFLAKNTAPDNSAVYNLKVVVKETGVKPDALRAWERRYGLPTPIRTAGRHRLYSQNDIELLKWLVARQKEGLSISKAVELWQYLDSHGKSPLLKTPTEEPALTPVPLADNTLIGLQEQWLLACMQFDEMKAEHVLAQAFALYPQETVCLNILQQGVAAIGNYWYQGQATVQQEHFVSSLATRRIEGLIAAAPPPTRTGQILTGCAPDEGHPFAALLLTFLLRRQGRPVIYLGAAVPVEQLEETLNSVKPALVIMVAQQLHTAATLKEMAYFLQPHRINLAFGGNIFNQLPELVFHLPGHFLGADLTEAPRRIASLMFETPPPVPLHPIDPAYIEALSHYRRQLSLINAKVWETLPVMDIPPANFDFANRQLSQGIMDALSLGSINFLNVEIDWVAGLLNYHYTGPEKLYIYLQTYLQALENHLDDRGAIIIDWLAEQLAAHGS